MANLSTEIIELLDRAIEEAERLREARQRLADAARQRLAALGGAIFFHIHRSAPPFLRRGRQCRYQKGDGRERCRTESHYDKGSVYSILIRVIKRSTEPRNGERLPGWIATAGDVAVIRYFSTSGTGVELYPDEEGLELAHERAAELEAANTLAAMARDAPGMGDRQDIAIEVRTEVGRFFKLPSYPKPTG